MTGRLPSQPPNVNSSPFACASMHPSVCMIPRFTGDITRNGSVVVCTPPVCTRLQSRIFFANVYPLLSRKNTSPSRPPHHQLRQSPWPSSPLSTIPTPTNRHLRHIQHPPTIHNVPSIIMQPGDISPVQKQAKSSTNSPARPSNYIQ